MLEITRIPRRHVTFGPMAAQRRAAGMSQLELARALGVSRTTAWRIESGRTNPSLELSIRIAAAMGRNLFQLIEVTIPKR